MSIQNQVRPNLITVYTAQKFLIELYIRMYLLSFSHQSLSRKFMQDCDLSIYGTVSVNYLEDHLP